MVSKLIRVIDVSVKQAVEKNREKSRVVDLWRVVINYEGQSLRYPLIMHIDLLGDVIMGVF